MTGKSEKFNQRAKPAPVIPYSQADDGLRWRMNRAMKEISRAPDSFEAVISYGHQPLDKLSRTLTGMLKLQGAFNGQMEKIADAVQVLRSDTKDAQQIDQAVQALRDTMAVTTPLMKEAGALTRDGRQVARGIDVHLGAGEKVSSLYAEKYIKEAEGDAQKTPSPDALGRLQDVKRRAEDFEDRRYVLGFSRAGAFEANQQLTFMTGIMKKCRGKVGRLVKTADKAHQLKDRAFEQAIYDTTVLARSIVLPKPFQLRK